MILQINFKSGMPIYLQIVDQIKAVAASGALRPGEALPSIRPLAEELRVNRNTVAKAYRDLEVMGLLYTRRGMGVFVNKNIEGKCREDCRRRIIGRLHEVVAESKAAGMVRKEIIEIIEASVALDASPYGETPASLTALAKSKKAAK